jgi:hypothetical protein
MRWREFTGPAGDATVGARVAVRLHMLFPGVCAVFFACSFAHAQTAALPPVFMPGLYETESRNSAFPDQPVTSRACVASRDYGAFRDETMAQYRKSPQFVNDCRLSDATPFKSGFALAMQCKGTKAVLTYEFEKDLVRGTIETQIDAAPEFSSSILIMMRRVGDCPEQGKAP